MPAIVHTGSFSVYFKNEHTIHENEVRCLVKESDFNLSYNPSLVSGSYYSGSLKDFATGSDFYTYATSLGLYNDDNELLAVAKLSKPVIKTSNSEMIIKIKLDY